MKLDDLKAYLSVGISIAPRISECRAANEAMLQALTAITDLEALVGELGEVLKRFVADFETDFCIEGVIVDDPDPMLKTHYVLARATLAKLEKARGKDQEHG